MPTLFTLTEILVVGALACAVWLGCRATARGRRPPRLDAGGTPRGADGLDDDDAWRGP